MAQDDWLADRFEEHRPHLRTVAYRMLGSPNDAEDAVQEAWIRLSRSDSNAVVNLGGWLTTVVARIALDLHDCRHADFDRVDEALFDVDYRSSQPAHPGRPLPPPGWPCREVAP